MPRFCLGIFYEHFQTKSSTPIYAITVIIVPANSYGKDVVKCSPKDVSAICADRGEIISVTAPPAQTVPIMIEIATPELREKLTARGIINAQVAQEDPIV